MGIDFIDRRLYWQDTLVLMEDLVVYNTTKIRDFNLFQLVDKEITLSNFRFLTLDLIDVDPWSQICLETPESNNSDFLTDPQIVHKFDRNMQELF